MSYKKFYEGGWQSGETGGTPITPEALNHMEAGIAGAVPLDGNSVVEGEITIKGDGRSFRREDANGNLIAYFTADKNAMNIRSIWDDDNARQFSLTNNGYKPLAEAVQLWSKDNGVATTATIFGSHNKPSGYYTGNGSGTSRTIDTGGVGSVICIEGSNGPVLVNPTGAIGFNGSNSTAFGLKSSAIKFLNGILTIATTDANTNTNGKKYYYHVL